MKKFFLFTLISFAIGKYSVGQKCYSIYYERNFVETLGGHNYAGVVKSRLLFNDTISFYYYLPQYGKDVNAKTGSFGDKLIHHSLFYNRNNNEVLNVVNLSKRKQYLAVDTPKVFNWVYNAQHKIIEGYKCNLAFSVDAKNDTLVIWYTNEIGNVFGPSAYIGLPGLPLEVFDQSQGVHIVATQIETTAIVLAIPSKYKRLTFEQHLKKIRR